MQEWPDNLLDCCTELLQELFIRFHASQEDTGSNIISRDHEEVGGGEFRHCYYALAESAKSLPHDGATVTNKIEDVISSCGRHLRTGLDRHTLKQWLNLHTEASLLKAIAQIMAATSANFDLATEVIHTLDMTLITTGGGSRKWEILDLIEHMDSILATATKTSGGLVESSERSFGSLDESSVPAILHHIDRADDLDIGEFQEHLLTRNTPLIITEALHNWPAVYLQSWSSLDYLLNITSNGQRLVPVEIGDSYVSKDWTQKIIPFKEFLETYILNPDPPALAYLAQHDVFSQIPRLREDITIPDYCYANHESALEEPIANAWFGPKGTVSPLHKDPYCNIFAQVAGYKYWKIFPKSETKNLYPRGEEDGVDMSNTSQVDVDGEVNLEMYPKYAEAQYREGILGPGEMLFLPKGSWHFVKSLTPSFSVSFWF